MYCKSTICKSGQFKFDSFTFTFMRLWPGSIRREWPGSGAVRALDKK